MTDIKYSGMNYSIKPSLHVSSRILIVNADFPCKMIRLQISCQLEIWLANALVGQRNFLIDRSVSYTRPLVCCLSGSALHHLWVCSGCASLFGDSPSRIRADTESRPWVWLVPAFCEVISGWYCMYKFGGIANPQTCEKLFKEKPVLILIFLL